MPAMLRLLTIVACCTAITACTGKTFQRSHCAQELGIAWDELSIAEADGFAGTVSYTKALGLLTAAKTMQTVENFERCYQQARDARFYIQESRKGQ